jgi:hypothetical protein
VPCVLDEKGLTVTIFLEIFILGTCFDGSCGIYPNYSAEFTLNNTNMSLFTTPFVPNRGQKCSPSGKSQEYANN